MMSLGVLVGRSVTMRGWTSVIDGSRHSFLIEFGVAYTAAATHIGLRSFSAAGGTRRQLEALPSAPQP